MAEFLAANPRDVIVIGMSNINCGDKEEARQQLLQVSGRQFAHWLNMGFNVFAIVIVDWWLEQGDWHEQHQLW